jgi:PLP dependent protein
MEVSAATIRDRIREVTGQIESWSSRPIDLVVVTKTHSSEVVRSVAAAGARIIGENYVQEVREKAAAIDDVRSSGVAVHFIGQLQTNKVRHLAGLVDCIASVDRVSLVDEIAKRMPNTRLHLQVNTTGEANKGGCLPETLPHLIERSLERGLCVEGLMTVGPTSADEQITREAFRQVNELASAHRIAVRNYGMSGDLRIAVEEGSTMVRIGSAILGERN